MVRSTSPGSPVTIAGRPAPQVGALCFLAALAPFNISPLAGDSYAAVALRPLIIVQLLVTVVLLTGLWRSQRSVVAAGRAPAVPRALRVAAVWLLAVVWLSAMLSDDRPIGAAGASTVTAFVATVVLTAWVVNSSDQAGCIITWIVAATSIAAVVGLVVFGLGRELWLTEWFSGDITRLGLQPRLTRPWAHANVAALAIGPALLLAWTGLLQRRPKTAIPLPAVTALLAVALVLTYSRGGVAAVLVAALLAAAVTGIRDGWRAGAMPLLGLVALLVVAAVATPGWRGRSGADVATADFAAEVRPPAAIEIGPDPTTVEVTVTNRSDGIWQAEGPDRIELSARWLAVGSETVVDEQRWPLPADIGPGQSETLSVPMNPSPADGRYEVLWDLLLDQEAYFLQFSGRSAPSAAMVTGSGGADRASGTPLVAPRVNLTRTEIWRIGVDAFTERPLLGVGPMQLSFRARADLTVDQRFPGAHAHNIVLEPLATWGLLGALPFFLLLAGALYRAAMWATRWAAMSADMRALRSSAPAERATGLAVLAALGVVLVHGAVEWPLDQVSVQIPFAILVGLAWSQAACPSPDPPQRQSPDR